jgi:tRNA-2-methylthio-N6-dimethylallyladenosine synthase
VSAVDGIRRVRYTSPHPNDFSDRVIAAMAEVPEVCQHVHLPMQSGSTSMLKRMLRRYSREEYLECVAKLRAAIPDSRSRQTSSSAFPARRTRSSRTRLRYAARCASRRVHVQVLDAGRHAATRMPAEWAVPDVIVAERFDRLVSTVRGISRELEHGEPRRHTRSARRESGKGRNAAAGAHA